MKLSSTFLLFSLIITTAVQASTSAITQSIPLEKLQGFKNESTAVKKLILLANKLSQQHLTYLYGSSDPSNQGMDCSGTVYYLLKKLGVPNPPRSANDMYNWVKQNGTLIKPIPAENSYKELNPGDLLFWSNTYKTSNKNNITHVMVYLGKNENNDDLMFGSSDGRTYQQKKMWGVSVFDFKEKLSNKGNFEGYSCIPNYTCQATTTQRVQL